MGFGISFRPLGYEHFAPMELDRKPHRGDMFVAMVQRGMNPNPIGVACKKNHN
jgi:hypothetical protein